MVNWQKVGLVSETGRYVFRLGYHIMNADDLEIRKPFLNAQSAHVAQPSAGPAAEFKSGTFNVTPIYDHGG
jgi:hypothetical protein